MPDLFHVCRVIQHLNSSGQESQKQFAVYDSDTPVTWKQGQGQQTWYELVDSKQGYNNARLTKMLLEQSPRKSQLYSFCKIRKHVNYLP